MVTSVLKGARVKALPPRPEAGAYYAVQGAGDTFLLYLTDKTGTITAALSVEASALPASVTDSLDLADTAVQPGDDVSDLAETATAKIMTGAERTKLAGVATGATANATDAFLLARGNHTGTQAAGTITGLATVATTGAYGDLSGLPILFDGAYSSLSGVPSTFAPAAHNQAWSTITATPTTRAGYGITDAASAAQGANADTAFGWGDHASAGYLTAVSWGDVTGKPAFSTVATTGAYSDLSGLPTLGGAASLDVGTTAGTVAAGNDSRMTNAREWTAATVAQLEAETGTATTRRAWTAQRVRQAITAWWAGSTDKSKLDGIADGATANATDAALRARSSHTGTQPAATITGLSTVATTGAYSDLTGLPTLFDGAYASLSGIPATFTPAAHNQAWSTITTTPTTLAGYGITDAATSAQGDLADTSVQPGDTIPLADGGTGATTAAGARTNLGLGDAATATVVTSDTDVTTGRLIKVAAGPAQAFRRGNILGTVSQSAGVPTGALIERGSNSNGEYLRFADGTQICNHLLVSSSGGPVTWTYPAAFTAAADAILMTASATSARTGTTNGGGNATSVGINGWDASGSRVGAAFHLTAFGRWF